MMTVRIDKTAARRGPRDGKRTSEARNQDKKRNGPKAKAEWASLIFPKSKHEIERTETAVGTAGTTTNC
jgi:hypothetical protein